MNMFDPTYLTNKKTIKIKYLSPYIDKIKQLDKSDWIDLRSSESISMKKGEFKLIPLGIAIELPQGYEAHIAPRSSTYKNFKIIQSNSVGVVDEEFKGNSDEWKFPAIAMEDTTINLNDRICQFRIVEKQPKILFMEVNDLENENRGGFGSTGIN